MSNITKGCPLKSCEKGGDDGLILLKYIGFPMYNLNTTVRAILYMMLLAWTFMGVAIVADVFMGAIERITSKKKRMECKHSGKNITVKVWNDTVANLTLMALGSSAPEILLSVIELCNGGMHSGEMGPSTIVGSAAFNLFCISAVCVMAIGGGEIRKVKDTHVFLVTASFSIFAYLWLYLIVSIISPNIIDISEAILTFIMFPLLVMIAYFADTGLFSSSTDRDETMHQRVSLAQCSKEELAQIEMSILQKYGENSTNDSLSDHHLAALIEKEHAGPKSRAQYRVEATRKAVGGRRLALSRSMAVAAFNGKACSVVPCGDSIGNATSKSDIPAAATTIEFCSTTYAVVENIGTVTINVNRTGDLDVPCSVDYNTRDGTAAANQDYMPVAGTLEFAKGMSTNSITVTIIDDTAYEDDEEFYIDLKNAQSLNADRIAIVGRNQTATVSIVDDDEPGMLKFEKDTLMVTEGLENKVVIANVKRTGGSTGNISCKYRTEDATARAGCEYIATSGTLSLHNGQTSAHIDLTICPRGRYNSREEFRLILTDPTDGARFVPDSEGGANSCILTVVIEPDENEAGRVDRIAQVLQMDWDKAQIGNSSWRDQFRHALFVNGGDDDDEAGDPSAMDWVMHIITLFWKLLFAIIPPVDFVDGWACFCSALAMIGLVTAVIGDLAGLLGCVMGLPDSITAITFVALGTSLPDTFASKTAAEQDPYADASIGNITGSNSVNVFLGLGLPWSLGAIYWASQDADASKSPVKEWLQKYPDVAPDLYAKGDIRFIVMGGSLGYSVSIFCSCAVLCLCTLVLRRHWVGGELGGPKCPQIATAIFFVVLWALYIILSSVKALEADCL